jgi:hypothetical protein
MTRYAIPSQRRMIAMPAYHLTGSFSKREGLAFSRTIDWISEGSIQMAIVNPLGRITRSSNYPRTENIIGNEVN